MKRYLPILGFVFVGVIAGLLVRGIPVVLHVNAGDGVSQTEQNGDVNGDQTLDMSDAVYLLIHLFNGGPEPVACAQNAELGERVDALEEGMGAVADEVGGVGEGLALLADAIDRMGTPCKERHDRFIEHGDGTVTDTCTGLMWHQRASLLQLRLDAVNEYLEASDLGGFNDWRLPTAPELEVLFSPDRGGVALRRLRIEPVFVFPALLTQPGSHPELWSSSGDAEFKWTASFYGFEQHAPTLRLVHMNPRAPAAHNVLAVRNVE